MIAEDRCESMTTGLEHTAKFAGSSIGGPGGIRTLPPLRLFETPLRQPCGVGLAGLSGAIQLRFVDAEETLQRSHNQKYLSLR